MTGIEDLTRYVGQLEQSIGKDRQAALAKEIALRGQQADVEDQLAQRRALLADLDARVKELIERQARLDAAASQRLADAAGVDIESINGSAAQIALVKETMKYLGIPYVWAGATPSGGFDCSGLVLYVYAKFGVSFPHGATMQAHMGTPVPFGQMEPADLVFFGNPSFYHHVGIYIGNGLFIEAPHTGDVVKVSQLAGRGCESHLPVPPDALTADPAPCRRRGRLTPHALVRTAHRRTRQSGGHHRSPWPTSPSRGGASPSTAWPCRGASRRWPTG